MKKKLFNRLFKFNAWIMAVAFVILGAISSFLISINIYEEKSNSLIGSAYNVSGIYSSFPSDYSPAENILFVNMISLINEIQGVDIFVTSLNGYVAYSTYSIQNNIITDIISENDFKNIVSKSEFKGDIKYKNGDNYVKRYSVAVPIYDDHNKTEGTVIIASDSYNIWPQVIYFFTIFIIAGIIILFLMYIFVYLFTKNITKPLEEMSAAAKKYAGGDFALRINVPNNAEMANLATTFNYMADNLDKLEKMRQSFIADVSHELRTPMTSISGFIDGILDGVIPKKDFNKYLNIVSQETKRLSRMTSSLLDVAKIQSGETVYVMNPFNIIENVTKTIISLESKIVSKNLDVKINTNDKGNLYVMGDNDAIYRVCYNLIENAVKFSYDGGKLTIDITEDNEKAYVSITNTGVGISKEDIPYIFERFYKADKSRSKNKTGSGIGLYLVKMIVLAHNGNISVESEENKFAKFKFSLLKAPDNFS